MKKQMHAVAAGIVAVALSLLAGVAWGKSFSLDLRNAGTSTRAVAANHSGPAMTFATDGILRSFNLDAGVADVGEVAVGDELTFTLFDSQCRVLSAALCSPFSGQCSGCHEMTRDLSHLVWNSSPSPHPGRAEKLGGS